MYARTYIIIYACCILIELNEFIQFRGNILKKVKRRNFQGFYLGISKMLVLLWCRELERSTLTNKLLTQKIFRDGNERSKERREEITE